MNTYHAFPWQRVVSAQGYTAESKENVTHFTDTLFCIDGSGTIVDIIQHNDGAFRHVRDAARKAGKLTELSSDQYLLPGLIDLHVHAPQWPQMGKALDKPLEKWLNDYTFPLEARYADVDFARRNYTELVSALLANGTTTAVYFATLHTESSVELARICLAQGQRALVGRVAMDDPSQCPDYYRDETAASAEAETRAFIRAVAELPGNTAKRVLPVITPRFIPSCTDDLLKRLGTVAKETGCHVQTHCSESDWEHGYVKERLGKTDTVALRDFGLLTPKTILAHSNHIEDDDADLIKKTGAGVAHCPLSNFYFANAVFPLRAMLDRGLNVGLGTDIAGGHSPSVFDACRHAITASKALNDGVDARIKPEHRGRPGSAVSFKEAFWLATAGAGGVLELPVGKLEVGYQFDAIVIDTRAAGSDIYIHPAEDQPEDKLQKIIFNARRNNISRVWVDGKAVKVQ
ncbi:TPA: guanine deaminase [Enterobacter ludwigii]|uniref:guanine deaminase n=2 Tax=Enterobacterales TaxID=91347 RepID=UPI0029FD32E7|nr:guanine deaminase [Enterobacter ludwigii]EKS7201288.1 guanine deaminase [Enterobacter ludwigii]HDR2686104.1 guanine deaminase [Enterobacter ludwigii]HDR2687048.1 guanine deaminase [Enterobacter ludwigii]